MTGCVSSKKFTSLSMQFDKSIAHTKNLETTISNLKDSITELNTKITDINNENVSLINTNEILKHNLIELQSKYEKVSRTAQYHYRLGNTKKENQEYYLAFKEFETIVNKYPTDPLSEISKKEIQNLKVISKNNYNKIIEETKAIKLKEQPDFIVSKRKDMFLISSDSIKLNNLYQGVLLKAEADQFIDVTDDKLQSCYFYETNRNTSKYQSGNFFSLQLYINQEYNGKKNFRIKAQFSGDDWMFYEKLTIRGSNGVQFSINTDYPEKKSESSGNGVTEWSDNYISSKLNEKIFKLAQAEEITVRFDGKYRYQITLNYGQQMAIKEIVSKYKSL